MSSEKTTLTELYECLSAPLDSVSLRRFFLMLIRAHWLDQDNHGTLSDYFDCMQYSDDPAKRKVDVQLSHVFDPEKGTTNPAMYIGFEGFKLNTVGLGDTIGRKPDNSARQEGKRADTVMSIGHISPSADTSLMMAESNATLLQGVHRDIISNMDILNLDVLGWSDARLMEKAPDRTFQVDLRCSISFNFMVEIDIESHRIKKFGTELNASAS